MVVTPPATVLPALGHSVRLSAQVRDQNGQVMPGVGVAWTSSSPGVATVDATGLVTAVANGATTITATVASVSWRST